MATKRPDGDGLVRKRSDGRWEGRIIVGHKEDGKPMFRSVFAKTQKELMDKLHRSIETFRGVELTENANLTLGTWLDKWLEERMRFTVRESTLDGSTAGSSRIISNRIWGIRKSAPSPRRIFRECTTGSGRMVVSTSTMRKETPSPTVRFVASTCCFTRLWTRRCRSGSS